MVQQRTGSFVKRKAALKFAADKRRNGFEARVEIDGYAVANNLITRHHRGGFA